MSLRKWLSLIVFLPLTLAAFLAGGSFVLAQATRHTEAAAQRVSMLYSSASQVTTSLLQADIQARAYAVTKRAADRDAYRSARQTLQFEFDRLNVQSRAEPLLAAQVPELERLAQMSLGSEFRPLRDEQESSPSANGTEAFEIAQKRFADLAYRVRARRLAGLARLWNIATGLLAFAVVAGLAGTIVLALIAQRHLARRIEYVERRARSYTSGTQAADTPLIGGNDEIGRLDEALLQMAETITTRESELRVALNEAESASRAKSAFMATISHELRTPLNGVVGMSELLTAASLPELEHEYAETISSSSKLLLAVINDILDFSRLAAGGLSLTLDEIAPQPLVRSVIASFLPEAERKGIALTATFEPGVPGIVLGDEMRLRQVLFNLVGNAVKFTAAGSISVAVSAAAAGDERTILTFEVSDTGIGIPEALHSAIFEPFRQADMSNTRTVGGTGLGLSISRSLARLMAGSITVRNAPGGGAVFSFTVPLPVKPETAPAAIAPAAPAYAGSVLIVEDNEINQRVAKRLLQGLGLPADIAENGREALSALERAHYDLILMDLQMPVMDGFEATIEMRKREALTGDHVPIVAMTANALPEDREACFAAGMDDHVAKPVTRAELCRVLTRWLAE